MKRILLSTAAALLTTSVSAQTITIEGVDYSTEPSPHSVEGANIYVCTPQYVADKLCTDVDQQYYDAQAVLQFGPWSISVMEGIDDATGETHKLLALRGGISTGISTELEAALKANPEIDTIVLASPGGNPEEAMLVYNLIKQAEMTTWVPEGQKCMSACAEIFLAGKERIITGVVGFHSAWYNWTIGMPTELDELIDFISVAAQKHQAVFSAQHQAAGLSGEFNIDIAQAEGEFLVFTSSEQLQQYSDATCFDCVDHTKFLRDVQTAQDDGLGDKDKVRSGITLTKITILASVGM